LNNLLDCDSGENKEREITPRFLFFLSFFDWLGGYGVFFFFLSLSRLETKEKHFVFDLKFTLFLKNT